MKRFKAWFIRQYEHAKHNLKLLGWLWGGICIIISGAIFYSPAIYFFILYLGTGGNAYLASASGYVVWWFLPMFSPALMAYGLILIVITTIVIYIKKLFRRRFQIESRNSR
jgi:uncharacterized membrane protein